MANRVLFGTTMKQQLLVWLALTAAGLAIFAGHQWKFQSEARRSVQHDATGTRYRIWCNTTGADRLADSIVSKIQNARCDVALIPVPWSVLFWWSLRSGWYCSLQSENFSTKPGDVETEKCMTSIFNQEEAARLKTDVIVAIVVACVAGFALLLWGACTWCRRCARNRSVEGFTSLA